jgi:hypothetical protein
MIGRASRAVVLAIVLGCLWATLPALSVAGAATQPGLAADAPTGLGQIDWASTVTLETSIGPVTCGLDPAQEPDWEDVQQLTSWPVLREEILGASALTCSTATLGQIEITPGGFPWRLTLNSRKRTGRLTAPKGRMLLEVRLLSLPSVHCTYRVAPARGTLSGEDPTTLNLSIRRVPLERKLSNPLCPTLGSLSTSLELS